MRAMPTFSESSESTAVPGYSRRSYLAGLEAVYDRHERRSLFRPGCANHP